MNVPCLKCPLDLWIYQEILAEVRPDLIIETGTHMGGSALYLAHMLDIIGRGEVITIDTLDHPGRPAHPRITYVQGSSADAGLIGSLLDPRPAETRLVILDSDHSRDHVLAELALLAPYVTVGSYVIVEDTNINGHPAYPSYGDGPHEAVEAFTRSHTNFVADRSREKFLMTFNPRGYLRRIS
jgi:cephalosporin hydroxylase